MFAEVVVVFCGRVGTCTGDDVRPYRRFTDRRIAKSPNSGQRLPNIDVGIAKLVY